MAAAIRPLLETIDEYRRSVAAPEDSKVLRSYANYTDLDYIKNRLRTVELEVHAAIYKENNPSATVADTILVDQMDSSFQGSKYSSNVKNLADGK